MVVDVDVDVDSCYSGPAEQLTLVDVSFLSSFIRSLVDRDISLTLIHNLR